MSLFWLPALGSPLSAEDYYRIETYDLPTGVNFEASGLAVTDKGKLAVALRKGEIWIEGERGFQRFAAACMRFSGSRFTMGRSTPRSVRRSRRSVTPMVTAPPMNTSPRRRAGE